jgi:hypothetical protein
MKTLMHMKRAPAARQYVYARRSYAATRYACAASRRREARYAVAGVRAMVADEKLMRRYAQQHAASHAPRYTRMFIAGSVASKQMSLALMRQPRFTLRRGARNATQAIALRVAKICLPACFMSVTARRKRREA